MTFGSGGDTLTLNFTGVTGVSLEDNPFTFASLGQFQTSVMGAGAMIDPGTTFSLTISQTQPTSGMGDLFSTVQGAITQNQSTSLLTFSVSSVTIGAETYALTNSSWPLVPPSTNNGTTSIQARISGPASVPDNGQTVLLLGTGVGGLFGMRRVWRPAHQG
jgi:VPDSG-CTERM motif